MNTRLALCTAALAVSLSAITNAAPAASTAGLDGKPDCLATLGPARLPHTPDAVEGWVRACYARSGQLTGVGASLVGLAPARLPHTPDAVEGWARACPGP
jgi:hypothetical protein